jgi:predicted nucleic acid-binding protein
MSRCPTVSGVPDLVRDASSGLRAGDALHLAVAREVGARSIATADANLAANAVARGLAAVPAARLVADRPADRERE